HRFVLPARSRQCRWLDQQQFDPAPHRVGKERYQDAQRQQQPGVVHQLLPRMFWFIHTVPLECGSPLPLFVDWTALSKAQEGSHTPKTRTPAPTISTRNNSPPATATMPPTPMTPRPINSPSERMCCSVL